MRPMSQLSSLSQRTKGGERNEWTRRRAVAEELLTRATESLKALPNISVYDVSDGATLLEAL